MLGIVIEFKPSHLLLGIVIIKLQIFLAVARDCHRKFQILSFVAKDLHHLLHKKLIPIKVVIPPHLFSLTFCHWVFLLSFIQEKVISSLAYCKTLLPFVVGNPLNHHGVLVSSFTKDLAPHPSHVSLLQDIYLPFGELKLQLHPYCLPFCKCNKSLGSCRDVSSTNTGKSHHLKRYSYNIMAYHCLSFITASFHTTEYHIQSPANGFISKPVCHPIKTFSQMFITSYHLHPQ